MSADLGLVVLIVVAWVSVGTFLSVVMSRRGHNAFAWLVLGTLMGPLAVLLAYDASRHTEGLQPEELGPPEEPAKAAAGRVDVLVGCEESTGAAAAVDAVVDLLGERLGRVTVATVVPFGDLWEEERSAMRQLQALADRVPGRRLGLEVLHGHPSTALREFATEGGYELIVVGTPGKGIGKTVLGSTANELARQSRTPVLLVGEAGAHR